MILLPLSTFTPTTAILHLFESPQGESASSGLEAGWSTPLLDLCSGIYTTPGTETFASETFLATLLHYDVADLNGRPHCHGR